MSWIERTNNIRSQHTNCRLPSKSTDEVHLTSISCRDRRPNKNRTHRTTLTRFASITRESNSWTRQTALPFRVIPSWRLATKWRQRHRSEESKRAASDPLRADGNDLSQTFYHFRPHPDSKLPWTYCFNTVFHKATKCSRLPSTTTWSEKLTSLVLRLRYETCMNLISLSCFSDVLRQTILNLVISTSILTRTRRSMSDRLQIKTTLLIRKWSLFLTQVWILTHTQVSLWTRIQHTRQRSTSALIYTLAATLINTMMFCTIGNIKGTISVTTDKKTETKTNATIDEKINKQITADNFISYETETHTKTHTNSVIWNHINTDTQIHCNTYLKSRNNVTINIQFTKNTITHTFFRVKLNDDIESNTYVNEEIHMNTMSDNDLNAKSISHNMILSRPWHKKWQYGHEYDYAYKDGS